MDKNEKKLHGNMARIDPKKHVDSRNITNMTLVDGRISPEQDVQLHEQIEYSRRFVDENKK
jgi:hypothetical protein